MARPRFPLRWKIALLFSALLAAMVAALALFTVYLPWRARLAAQAHLALERVRPLSPTIVRLSSSGVSFRADVMRDLVLNSGGAPGGQGDELLFALLYDAQGELQETASVANTQALGRLSPKLLGLYRTDPRRALEQLAERRGGIQRVSVSLKLEGQEKPVGRMLLGLVTSSIDADARGELFSELGVLLGALAIALASATLLSRRITRPLDALSAAMGEAQKGELDEGIEVDAGARDELGDLARAFNSMIHGLRERERLRGTLGRYVSGDIAERILSERDDLSLRGEIRHVTVLFLDVRGFSALSELLTPQELVATLNDYFHVMVEAVQRRGGTVNKFIGDAALCLWGAPRAVAQPELSAVQAALEIQRGAAALSESRVARGLPTVEFGIGINAGEALAGNLGSAARLEYTVIGDAVNLAQRLETQAKAGEVLVSESIHARVLEQVEWLAREPVRLKGKSEPVPLWEVRALKALAVALACLAGGSACERDSSRVSDELTITVRGDRHELELQEKELDQRESELRREKGQLEAQLDQLVKQVGDADQAQRQRNDTELKSARERERLLDARMQSVLAEKGQIDARKNAVEAGQGGVLNANVNNLNGNDSLAAREVKVAAREAAAAERDAELARREKELAAREAAQAEAERSLNAKVAEQKSQAAREVPQASAVEARHKKLLDELASRGVLIADLPVEAQPLNADIWAARRQGDLVHASDLLAELAGAAKQLKIDQHFVEQKMIRLQRQRGQAKLSDAQRTAVESLLRDVTGNYSDARYESANQGLNRIAAILDAAASPG